MSLQPSTLKVDYTWKKWHARISSTTSPNEPIYIVNYQCLKCPNIIVKSATSNEVIGTGTLNPVSINAHFTLHGRKSILKALKRWKTEYTHLSYAFASTPGSSPATMTWTSTSNFKTWDFICLDEQQTPVAKFSANFWSFTKIGKIEFLGPNAGSEAVRDEIVVTGLTLAYCMVLRTTNLVSFFGAIFARPGPIKKKDEKGVEYGVGAENGDYAQPKPLAKQD